MLNIAPAISSVPISVLYVGPSSEFPRVPPDKPLKYDSFAITHPSGTSLELLVEFNQKTKSGNYIEYERAILSYNSLLVSAEKIRLNQQETTAEATGNVLVEDGERRLRTKSAMVRITNGLLEVTTY